MGGEDGRLVTEFARKPVCRMPLVMCLLDGQIWGDKIGTTNAAIQQATTGEDDGVIPDARGVGHGIGRVARRMNDLDSNIPDHEVISVVDLGRRECDIESGGHDVLRAMLASKFETTRDVVVVEVRLHHMRDAQPVLGNEVFDSVDVALWVHDEGCAPIMDDVTAVTESGGVERDDMGYAG